MFAIPLSILRNNCTKSKNSAKKELNKVFGILGHLPNVKTVYPAKNNLEGIIRIVSILFGQGEKFLPRVMHSNR